MSQPNVSLTRSESKDLVVITIAGEKDSLDYKSIADILYGMATGAIGEWVKENMRGPNNGEQFKESVNEVWFNSPGQPSDRGLSVTADTDSGGEEVRSGETQAGSNPNGSSDGAR